MKRAILVVGFFASGCAPTAMQTSPAHPAHPDAPTGRLAGPPPALRPGVVETPAQPPEPPKPATGHEHHH